MKKAGKTIALMLAAFVAFSGIFAGGSVDSYAASAKPSQVTGLRAASSTPDSITLVWNKASKAKGYEVYRGNTLIATVKDASFTETGLTPVYTYKYKVRAYNIKVTKKVKYYNSKKKKWVNKKPKKSQWKGRKKKTVKTKLTVYGKYSDLVSGKTQPLNSYPSLEEVRSSWIGRFEEQLNTVRAERGIPYDEPLNVKERLNDIAQRKAEYMASVGKPMPYSGADNLPAKYILENEYIWASEGGAANVMNSDDLYGHFKAYEVNIDFCGDILYNPKMQETGGVKRYYEDIGIGYCQGYLCIVIAAPKYE